MPSRSNRTMPPATVIPQLVYDDVGAAVEWLCATFGFAERWHVGDHRAQLTLGNSTIVVTEPRTSQALPGPQSLLVRVDDVDAHHARTVAAGATVIAEPRDHAYGERQYAVEDPGGHHWGFSQSIADVAPEDWGGTSGPALDAAHGPLVSVMLIVPDADAAAAWYGTALGASELWNLGGVAGLEITGAPFFLHENNPKNPSERDPVQAGVTSTRIELFVEDPDAVLRRAADAGATVTAEMTSQPRPWGVHRQGSFRDPYGHRWSVGDRSPLWRSSDG
ncbi:MAG TPA: VOC family protein [Solirubrobacteraceae bacterium]